MLPPAILIERENFLFFPGELTGNEGLTTVQTAQEGSQAGAVCQRGGRKEQRSRGPGNQGAEVWVFTEREQDPGSWKHTVLQPGTWCCQRSERCPGYW